MLPCVLLKQFHNLDSPISPLTKNIQSRLYGFFILQERSHSPNSACTEGFSRCCLVPRISHIWSRRGCRGAAGELRGARLFRRAVQWRAVRPAVSGRTGQDPGDSLDGLRRRRRARARAHGPPTNAHAYGPPANGRACMCMCHVRRACAARVLRIGWSSAVCFVCGCRCVWGWGGVSRASDSSSRAPFSLSQRRWWRRCTSGEISGYK